MTNKVLIIEDDEDVYDFLESLFEEKGYHVQVAHNGKEGMQKVKEFWPHLIMLDLMMPSIDGFGVLKLLSELEPVKRPKVIVLSAIDNMGGVEEALHLGAAAYLTKPIETPRLLQKIKEVMGG